MTRMKVRLVTALTIVLSRFAGEAQQPKKVPRIGYLSALDRASESARAEAFGWLCASLATKKNRTSPSNTDIRRDSQIGLLRLRPSWCVLRLMSLWVQEGTCGSGQPRMLTIPQKVLARASKVIK
jgi:hypothetical protein